ncbi:hypothetical protein RND71_032356 [Anisodus tanguticus]|uniref:Uncharacterized protein n=1 Tax=Anisodus tanguticus TaxID=243964 RepID=A0AAE1V454_9SOLA|nr:hypothetical protein RND71_032356 [Anisodus tanguticus]
MTSSSSSGEINSGRVGCDSEPAFFRSISRNVSSETEKGRKTASSSSSGKINGGDGEVAFFRSKSVGIPLLKSLNTKSTKTASFWWIFKSRRRGKENELEMKAKGVNDNKYYCNDTRIKEFSMTVMRSRSRSVNVAMTSVSGGNDVSDSPEKLKGWYLLSPMKVFRQSKAPKLVI